MNISNFAHAGLAIVFQVIVAICLYILGLCNIAVCFISGALFAVGFYFGREVTQHQRKEASNKWWRGFKIKNWSTDAVFDLIFPVLSTTIVTIIAWIIL